MSRALFDRLAIIVGTIAGAIATVIVTNSFAPVLMIAAVVYLASLARWTREAPGSAEPQKGADWH
jgi:hypothetical protein